MEQVLKNIVCCPLSHEVMSDPVFAADGYIYERQWIENWLRFSAMSPMTEAPMPHRELFPAAVISNAIATLRCIYDKKSSLPYESTHPIPKSYVGAVIGNQGHVIRRIEGATGCTISIDKSSDPCLAVVAHGDIDAAHKHIDAAIVRAERKAMTGSS